MRNIRTDTPDYAPDGFEHDACAIYMSARKHGQSTFGTLKRSLGALVNMGHRTGFVNGEGDGAGVQTDIPRRLWSRKLSQAGMPSYLATHPGFWVGHLFVPASADFAAIQSQIHARFDEAGLNLLLFQLGRTRREALGQNARINPPAFYQLAGYSEAPGVEKRLLQVQTSLEGDFPIQFASLSSYTVVYKVRGSVESLARFYPDLQDHNFDTSMVLCHARYSTNTVSTFERAQPFAVLGHNGEINTINRLRVEGVQIGAILPRDGSDSQDLDRVVHTLCVDYGLSLVEAMEMVFPPVPHEVDLMPAELRAAYRRIRQSFGPYAQGPAGIVARYGNTIVASVDALGLRPLWYVETEKEYIFSSERGAIPLEQMATDARALAPGEKIAIHFQRGENPEVWDHTRIRQHVMVQSFQREVPQLASSYWKNGDQPHRPGGGADRSWRGISGREATVPVRGFPSVLEAEVAPALPPEPDPALFHWLNKTVRRIDAGLLAANGWVQEHIKDAAAFVSTNKDDLVSALGYDGPLAALSKTRVNLADFYKESVAVVTNPAIDHAREVEAFSTSTLVGACQPIGKAPDPQDILVILEAPLLLGGHAQAVSLAVSQKVAQKFGILTLEEVIMAFHEKAHWLAMARLPGETVRTALERLAADAVAQAQAEIQCLILDDALASEGEADWLDPLLAAACLDNALRSAPHGPHGNLRRRVGVVMRTAALRTLHDFALLSGFGVDAVNPYALIGVALKVTEQPDPLADEAAEDLLTRLTDNLIQGLEKVTSTMGCHELRGYGKAASAVGLAPGLAAYLGAPNYFGSEAVGMTWERLDQESGLRGAELRGQGATVRLGHVNRFNPKFWKVAFAYAKSEVGYNEVKKTYQNLANDGPVSLRHIVGIKHVTDVISPSDVDISIGDYALPLIIDAMSFGSQGETSYKSYAHAASVLNMICVNGEGGELPEIMGKYRHNRGQQVASGRFGVNVEFLNSAAVLEIKIGQGAKPGEGGMLPGYKVNARVAEARRTPEKVTLLSPSNNHDLYSIEDLAQLIEELRMVNPLARISVKVPVVPGIGVIAVGVAKAGADILNISGYDGGTGAARKHSLQYAGLPTEIGVIQVHRALIDAGLRHKVEIWSNGGMKTGEDAVKMILLGANRVGFGTLAMIAIGCTICRQCNLGTCHVGIATQLQTKQQAYDFGVKHFTELEFELSVMRLTRMFKGLGEEIRQITAGLGATRLQDLVGRADLLEQVQMHDKIDLTAMFEPAPIKARPQREPGVGVLLIRPRNSLTTVLTDLIVQTVGDNEREVTYQDSVSAIDRALGARLAGELIRQPDLMKMIDCLHLRFGPSSLAGNGFAAWSSDQMDILIEGGAQDGVAKGASGGRVAVMKGLNHDGLRIDGSVGKSFAYGAQSGTLIVQGNADSRACVRLSGAEVVFGGEITEPIDDGQGSMGTRANLKGFACEYMTSGMVLIMGDPGPYAFSGMTGGTVYQHMPREMGFDEKALRRRLAKGATVKIQPVNQEDTVSIRRLLRYYIEALEQTYQYETAERMKALSDPDVLLERFVKVTAGK
jgi:glutamate synthase (NADPH/NADH) large chain